MLKRYKILIGIIALMLLGAPFVMGARLDDTQSNRYCYKDNLPFWVCVLEGTNIMEASFIEYQPMHDYYTPQLKEVLVTGGSTQTLTTKRTATITVTGSPTYLYVKHQ